MKRKTYILKIEGLDYIALEEHDRGKSDKELIQQFDDWGEDGRLAQGRIDALMYFMSEVKKYETRIHSCYDTHDNSWLLVTIYCHERTMKRLIKKVNSRLPVDIRDADTYGLKFILRTHMLIEEHICLEAS